MPLPAFIPFVSTLGLAALALCLSVLAFANSTR